MYFWIFLFQAPFFLDIFFLQHFSLSPNILSSFSLLILLSCPPAFKLLICIPSVPLSLCLINFYNPVVSFFLLQHFLMSHSYFLLILFYFILILNLISITSTFPLESPFILSLSVFFLLQFCFCQTIFNHTPPPPLFVLLLDF